MVLGILLLAAGTAFAGAPQKDIAKTPEETLYDQLLKLRHRHDWEVRQSVFEGADDLRDAVTSSAGPDKVRLADRLPGMALNPFEICLDLISCPQAPSSLHVDDAEKIDEAFVALARPWIKLQEARGKEVTTVVEHGVGVQLKLEDFPRQPVVTLTAEPAETGGFDVASDAGPAAAKAFVADRAAVLQSKGR
ncbi:MAG TPA: hypothetical protein VH309_01280 [Elusimicrobiota bacterium]|jgi:hypothetical protein|nr:hypothetical protein [Elusimicrobiota bacterium]